MPFAVFRRHSKKLLAVFAILSMIGFVLSDSLPALLKSGSDPRRNDMVVAELYGKEVRRSDLAQLSTERNLANAFMANLAMRMIGRTNPQYFGDTDLRSLIDAYILEHEADKLGMPNSTDLAHDWLTRITSGQMDAQLFEQVLHPFRNQNQVTGEQMLGALANQVRLMNVGALPGLPDVTPLDIYQAYRDRYERVSVSAVRIPVADFLSQVREPTTAEVQAYYDRYKEVEADPTRDTPGFKIPRQVQVEFASTSLETLASDIRDKLTERELLDHYELHKTEFQLPPLDALPMALFADDPQNKETPLPSKPTDASPETIDEAALQYQPFTDVRSRLQLDLSHEKARAALDEMFSKVRDAMFKYSDVYNTVIDENKEAKTLGTSVKPLPPRPDLSVEAKKAGLTMELSPLLSREAAAHYGQIGSAHVGQSRTGEGPSFVDEMFTRGVTLFEPIELMNDEGRAFLAWKIADNPPRVPPLTEIQPQVVVQWKLEQARPLALKAAEEVAAKAREAGGKLTPEIAGKWTIVNVPPIAKLESSMLPMPGQFNPPRPRPTEIVDIPDASDALRDALFELEPGDIAVASDQPKANQYVMALNKRYPVNYAMLYGPTGQFMVLKMEVMVDARERLTISWMEQLRKQAGLKPDWSPPEEAETRVARRDR